MNSEAETEIERLLKVWRSEPLTVIQAAQIAMKWAYEDAAKICDDRGNFTTAVLIRDRAK